MNATAAMVSIYLPTVSLWRREIVRFLRQRSRIVGALGTPILFWLLIGSGFRHALTMPGDEAGFDYLTFAFPGTIVLIVLFTAIFSMISVIEDRHEGFLQGVLVAPVSRTAIVLGKLCGGASLALLQAGIFLLLAPLAGVSLTPLSLLLALLTLTIIAFGLCALGFLIAWSLDSTQGFHAIMNLALIPMWLLSGSFFPAAGAASWITWLMAVNPLMYGVASLRYALATPDAPVPPGLPSPGLSIVVTVSATLLAIALATRAVRVRKR